MPFDTSIPESSNVMDEDSARQWLDYYMQARHRHGGLGLDTETTGLSNWKDVPLLWSLSDMETRTCIDARLLPFFRPLLEDPASNFDISNAKFDAHMLANAGIDLSKAGEWRDIVVMSWLHDENKFTHGLKENVKLLFGRITPTYREVFGQNRAVHGVKKTEGELIREALANPVRAEQAADYASLDAYNHIALRLEFDRMLDEEMAPGRTFKEYFYSVCVPFTKVLWKMERRGIQLDRSHFLEHEGQMRLRLSEIETEFNRAAGKVINVGSTKQLTWFFFEHKGVQPTKKTKKGAFSLDSEVMEDLAGSGDGHANLLLEYRDISKTLGTYIEGITELADHKLRVHTTLRQAGTVTGRLSCVDGSTLLRTNYGTVRISELDLTKSQNCTITTHMMRNKRILDVFPKGEEEMFEVTTNRGEQVICTKDHMILTPSGWRKLAELTEGDEVVSVGDGAGTG